MHRIMFVIVPIVLLTGGCVSVRSQGSSNLDSVFTYYFHVLDSVASGEKEQQELTKRQAAFLYVINGWTNSNANYDHYKGLTITPEQVKEWRQWYSRNTLNIDEGDFRKAHTIYYRLFS